MKLKAIHCYQYVRFQGKNENYLTPSIQNGMPDLELEWLLKEGVVSVKTAKDHILVFPTNIAYCVPLTEETKTRDVSSRGKLTDIDPGTPRK